MSAKFFVDTNVLVYARDASESEKQPQAADWMRYLWRSQAGRLSTQVLNEYYVTVTRKLSPGMAVEDARRDIRNLVAWQPVPLNTVLRERAWQLQDRLRLSFWDALIAAAAQVADCRYLLSEDMQDGQDLDGVTVVSPFRHGPDRLGPD